MKKQNFYLNENDTRISRAENRYDFLPEMAFVNQKSKLNNLCKIATKNIANARMKGKSTQRIEKFLREYRDYACTNFD